MDKTKCPNCGANLIENEDYQFCPYCGVGIPISKQRIDIHVSTRHEDVAKVEKQKRKAKKDKHGFISDMADSALIWVIAIGLTVALIISAVNGN